MLRYAVASEIDEVASIYRSVWHETHAPLMPAEECARRTPAFFIDRMRALLATTLIVRHGGAIAGFASWQGSLLGQLYVLPQYRGSGVASQLIETSETEMARSRIAEAELHCVIGNHRARRFYERSGWRYAEDVVEQVCGQHGPCDVAFWRMTKHLASPA